MSLIPVESGDRVTINTSVPSGFFSYVYDSKTGRYWLNTQSNLDYPILRIVITGQNLNFLDNIGRSNYFTLTTTDIDGQTRILRVISPGEKNPGCNQTPFWDLPSNINSSNQNYTLWWAGLNSSSSGLFYNTPVSLTNYGNMSNGYNYTALQYITTCNNSSPIANLDMTTNGQPITLAFLNLSQQVPTKDSQLLCCAGDSSVDEDFCTDKFWGASPNSVCNQVVGNYCGTCENPTANSNDPLCGCVTSCMNISAYCFDTRCVNNPLAYKDPADKNPNCPSFCGSVQTYINQGGNTKVISKNYSVVCGGEPEPTNYTWIILIIVIISLVVIVALVIYFYYSHRTSNAAKSVEIPEIVDDTQFLTTT